MKSRAIALVILVAFSSINLSATASAAQQETATITGEIHDSTGAAIPNASITVTNVETNISFKSESNDSGIYTLVSLKPGIYTLEAEKGGFRKLVRSKI